MLMLIGVELEKLDKSNLADFDKEAFSLMEPSEQQQFFNKWISRKMPGSELVCLTMEGAGMLVGEKVYESKKFLKINLNEIGTKERIAAYNMYLRFGHPCLIFVGDELKY